uniref:Uncharacterized protein MANES_15G090100 n=1 Tax=Rhizophora mucronata TaxID=61149 RepID=A0A2P2JQV6_RHIMU
MENSKLSSLEYSNNYTRLDTSVQGEGCSQNMFNGISHAAEWSDGITHGKLKGIELSGRDDAFQEGFNNLCDPDHEGRSALSGDGYVPNIIHWDHSKDEHCQSSMVDNQAAINMKNEGIRNALGTCDTEPTIDLLVTVSNSGSLQNSNGCRLTEPVIPFENGLCNSGESAASGFSGLGKFHSQINGLEGRANPDGTPLEHSDSMEDKNSPPGKTKHISADFGITCLYGCCSRCLYALHGVVLKLLTCEWQKNKSNWTAEHVHDVVSSLSMDLIAAVRKVDTATNISKLLDESLKHQTPERLSAYPGLHECHCSSSDGVVVPMECSCHSMDGCLIGKANDFPDSQIELDPKFVLRDGILVPVDSNRDASFHCKYESLCLCPLVHSIVMMKQPFD